MKKVGIFVDIRNLYYCINQKFLGKRLDYQKYLKAVLNNNYLFRAIAYGVQVGDEATKFINCLQYFGYEVKYKRLSKINHIIRENWTVGLSMDVVRLIDKLDLVIIGSADRDLIPLIEWVGEQGIQCIVYASNIPMEVKDVCYQWYEVKPDLLEENGESSEEPKPSE